jgi:hypothetical protein
MFDRSTQQWPQSLPSQTTQPYTRPREHYNSKDGNEKPEEGDIVKHFERHSRAASTGCRMAPTACRAEGGKNQNFKP